jgi:hypothetical protein
MKSPSKIFKEKGSLALTQENNVCKNQMAEFKVGKMLIHAVIIGLLLAILLLLLNDRQSTYTAVPVASITTVAGANASADPASIFDLKNSISCVPGPSEDADYYTQGLNPGGMCGGGAYVRDQQRDYAIADGVGGSLLTK